MPTREQVMGALFTLLQGAASFAQSGRRLKLWTEVHEQPALFLRDTGETVDEGAPTNPARVTLEAEVWIYAKTDPDGAPGATLNNLIDAVWTAMQPGPAFPCQTLGGLVAHAWIDGHVEKDPGDLDSQAKAVIPIRILIP